MNTVSRRTVLKGAVATGALSALAPVLAACGTGGGTGAAESSNAGVRLPTYTPLAHGPVPDLPASPDGVLAGFLKYPASPVRVMSGTPGDGSTVAAFVETYSPVAPALGSNTYWQALNKALGVTLDMQVVPAADYTDKLNTIVAGSSLPDLVQIRNVPLPPDLPSLLRAEFADLSEFLAGDAVRAYPMLANIPTVYWKSTCVWNGALYGIPIPRSIMGDVFYYRADILARKGLNPRPASYAEFAALCRELADSKHNVWALTAADVAFGFIEQMLGVPNNATTFTGWTERGGKLVNSIELPETKEALARCAELWQQGLIHPDSFGTATTDLTTNYKQWFNAGSAVLDLDNWTAWWQFYAQNVAGPSFRVGGMLPPDYDSGSKAITWQATPSSFSFTAVKKAPKARLKVLLKVCDWLAAPFGSAEYLLKTYGVSGTDWVRKNGDLAQTSTGTDEVPGLGVGYVAAPPYPLYYPDLASATTDVHTFMARSLPMSVGDPTTGLYAQTSATKGPGLTNQITDARHAIMQGQQPLSSWDEAVATWRSSGGDQMRAEFETALHHSA